MRSLSLASCESSAASNLPSVAYLIGRFAAPEPLLELPEFLLEKLLTFGAPARLLGLPGYKAFRTGFEGLLPEYQLFA